jgi:PAS domain S-box-containing protein
MNNYTILEQHPTIHYKPFGKNLRFSKYGSNKNAGSIIRTRRVRPLALIVDDEKIIRLMASASLQGVGFSVEEAESGAKAIAAFERLRPDIVLLDVLMGDMDGFGVCAALRRMPGGDRTPIIMMTVLEDIESINRAYEVGATDFITKPVNGIILGHRARHILRASRAVSTAQECESRFQELFDNVPVGLFRATREFKLIDVNPALVAMGGFPDKESCLRVNVHELCVNPDDGRKFQAEMESRGIVRDFEVQLCRPNGKVWWAAVNARPARKNDGRSLCYEGSLQDITERKRAEVSLRGTNQVLQTLVHASPLVITVHDPEGNVRMWNRAAEQVFGWKEDEVAGRPDPTVPEDKEEEWRALRKRALEGGTPTGVEVRRRGKDGSPVYIRLSASPLRHGSGDMLGIMSVVENITERRIAEEERQNLKKQLFQAAKMEAVGRLAAGVSHDFNNLLTAIEGYSDLLLGQLDEADPRRGSVEEIRKAGERACALTRQLLTFCRQKADQPKVLSLNRSVANLESMLRRLIGESIEIRTLLDPGLWMVKTDPGRIEQVIINLAVNARDAMPQGGKLSIETANVQLDDVRIFENVPVRPGRYVMLVVSDNGLGMDEETKRHMFDPFFTTKESDKGTGLGLSVVYGIVKHSGGYIWVYSEPGGGSTFKIYLPRVEEGSESIVPAAVSSGHIRGSETVLLVEDDDVVRRLIREILERSGYTVFDARNGSEALNVCERSEERIQIMVTDMVMPEMSGVELSRRIGSLRPGMKIVYMSGYSDNVLAYHGILDPGTAFLQKPFTPDDLERKVREVLDG